MLQIDHRYPERGHFESQVKAHMTLTWVTPEGGLWGPKTTQATQALYSQAPGQRNLQRHVQQLGFLHRQVRDPWGTRIPKAHPHLPRQGPVNLKQPEAGALPLKQEAATGVLLW